MGKQNSGKLKDMPVVKLAFYCIDYCLKCFERFMEFLSKNAYIQTQIKGSSFCTGARDAFGLLMRNFLRLATVSAIGGFFVNLGKLVICLGTTAIGALIVTQV